jgi:GTP-binding protein
MRFNRTTFIKSVVSLQERPPFHLPEIVLVGRSNVGKSSLINALTEQRKLSKVSSNPGKTRYLNYFNVDDQCYLVDAPGFGYTSYGGSDRERFGDLMESFFHHNPDLKGGLYLIDSRREWTQEDEELKNWMLENNQSILIIWTKIDQLNQSEMAQLKKKMTMFTDERISQLALHQHDQKALQLVRQWIESQVH